MAGHVIDIEDADGADVDLLGGKGAGLASMTREGLRVPPGFIITTAACREYLERGTVPDGLFDEVDQHLARLEERTGKTFGHGPRPLLVSVRSGAPVSMPGMMDTILNLGLTREAATALAAEVGDSRFVSDLARRLHTMYAETVLDAMAQPHDLDDLLAGIERDADPGPAFDAVWGRCATALADELGDAVPTDPRDQLVGAIEAVFDSWNTRRAKTYREFHGIPHTLGTAVVVQTMVFGNLGSHSGSGVVFTRNPVDGTPALYGEFLVASQGEDVVSGEFTPERIETAEQRIPAPFAELRRLCADLERRRGDVLDIEFTIERETLYFLQVRSAKRTAEAALRIAEDFLNDPAIPAAKALAGVTVDHVRQLQRPTFDADEAARAREDGRLVTSGVGACPGQVTGVLCFDSDEATRLAGDGIDVVLARPITSPADLHGMIASRGIITATGGATSHAAVVARALGTACVVGCGDLEMDVAAGTLAVGDITLRAGDEVSLDGASGDFFVGSIPVVVTAERTPELATVTARCAAAAGCDIYARITLPAQAEEARSAGATGLVAGLDDILAAHGHLDDLISRLLKGTEIDVATLRDVVTTELTAFLAATEGLEVSLRAVDFLSDDVREYVHQTPLLTSHPELSLPLGLPALVEAQLTGVARAMQASGRRSGVTVAVRHLNDAREAAALARIGDTVAQLVPGVQLRLASYATSARSLLRAEELSRHAPIAWIELRQLQAAHLGLPSRMLLTQQPLDAYLRAGLLDLDPRQQLDPGVAELLARLPEGSAGVRLSLPVSEALIGDLYERGQRRFAVELSEVRPLTLALGKAAVG